MDLFDTHAHLDDEQLAADVAGVVDRAAGAGVSRILAVGTTAESSRNCFSHALRFPGVWSSAGIHPNHAAEAAPGDWDTIVRLSNQPRVVALGETGLDLYWKDTPLPLQQDHFDRHIRLAQATGLPFIVHLRETASEILAMLHDPAQYRGLRGVMHSLTGAAKQAEEFLSLGMHISFAGMVTFKKSDDLRQVAANI